MSALKTIDHDQPAANTPMTIDETTLKIRSARLDIPFRCQRLAGGAGRVRTSSLTVDQSSSIAEVEFLLLISPLPSMW